jgi:serine/threonine protein kinase
VHVPGYEVERLLGQGNMGSAYLAHGIADNRKIVLQIVHLTDQPGQEQLKRFMLEYNVIPAPILRAASAGQHSSSGADGTQ